MKGVTIFVFIAALTALAAAGACSGGAQGTSTGTGTGAAAGAVAAEGDAPVSFAAPPPVGTRATCPVMGEAFVVGEATPRSEYGGRYYVFCCPGCKPAFDADPAKYAR